MVFKYFFYCFRICLSGQSKSCFAGVNSYISFFYLKCTIIRYMGFILEKKIMREYRLVRDFNFITHYKVSQSVLLRCTQTDTLVNNRNIFSNLSALLAQTVMSSCWDPTWFTITSKNTMTLLKMLFIKVKSRQPRLIASSFGILNMILDEFTPNVRS